MKNRYKVIIQNKRIYKEIELSEEGNAVALGTTKNCQVRFNKELFFGDFNLGFSPNHTGWTVNCHEDIYISTDGIMKQMSRDLIHGDEFVVKYQDSNQEIFKISYMLDFEFEKKDYHRIIDISNLEEITIGGHEGCNLYLLDELIGRDMISLTRQNGRLYINDHNSKYGIYVNGAMIKGTKEIVDYDFFSVIGYIFYYKAGRLYTSKENNLIIKGLDYEDMTEQLSHMKYPKFNRNTRIKYVIPDKTIDILPPEQKPAKPKKNIILTLIPIMVMLALVIVIRGVIGGGGTFVIYSVCTMTLGGIMSVVTYVSDKKQYKKDIEEREINYHDYIMRKQKEIKALRAEELNIRRLNYISLNDNINQVDSFGKRLFEKSSGDEDFLHIYLGEGTVEASCQVKVNDQEFITVDDPLVELPEKVESKYHFINSAPIIADFRTASGVGVVGPYESLIDIFKNMTIDLVARHFYKDVKLFYLLDEECVNLFDWLRWLPHVHNDMLDVRNIICDEESRNVLLEYLYAQLSHRENLIKEKTPVSTHYVVFILNSKEIHKHPISKYFERGSELGFTFIFFETYEDLLPKGCTEIIRLNDQQNTGNALLSSNGHAIAPFTYEMIDNTTTEDIAIKLSSVYVDEVSLESELTKSISLFQLLDIMSVSDLDLRERWDRSEIYKSMAAPLGVKKKGEIVYLNLSDKADGHGPHGLVAGTTGSGKSEIIQSYILAMASLFHPYDVGFVIIDFKGGGMVNQFRELPHLIGAITNIDGREVNRSLLSIKAEIIRRQELFSEYGVNHINDYIKLYKKGETKQPLPHLIMIADEFAELKAEHPEFMKEIISAARIGRTLGVHLILATQKPSGVVNNQIWSNSKFKLCLKVQTKEDSNEVIKTPLASEIVEPGRAYFQVGNNEIFELFQSAYSGAKVPDYSGNEQKEYDIYALNTWGKRSLVYTNKKKQSSKDSMNQLEAIVEHVSDHCKLNGIIPLPGICLPPLPDVMYYTELEIIEKVPLQDIIVPVGLVDDPEQQSQEVLNINLSESNTYIIGSAQNGKTTLLQTMVYGIMDTYTPSEVNMYIVDGGNMAMKVFDGANHIGGIALVSEEEKVINLFKLLNSTIKDRKNIFADKGIGTFKSYTEAGYTDLPQILVFIDNMSVFKEHFAGLQDEFLKQSREGLSVGINFVVTATQTNAIGYKVLSNYGTRITFQCNDKGEYTNLFGRCRIQPKEVPGRALMSINKRVLEFHTALCVEGNKEIERVENIKAFVKGINTRYSDQYAASIPVVPEIINQSELMTRSAQLYKRNYVFPVGMDYQSVSYVDIDLLALGVFAIMGKPNSGKTNFLRSLLFGMSKTIFDNLTEAYIFDGPGRQLAFCKDYGFVKGYSLDASDAEVIIQELCEELEERQEECNNAESPDEFLSKIPLTLIIIENPAIVTALTKNKELSAALMKMIKQNRTMKTCVIFSNLPNAQVAFNAPDVLKTIKENKKAAIFDDYSNIKFFDTGIKTPREFAKPIKQGDAYLFSGNSIKRIKTIFND